MSEHQATSSTFFRVHSVDLLRGLVMIIMALDHVREFIHAEALIADPLNLQTTTPALFFTRWITHFCAPIFVFLAGTSAYLQSLRKDKKELRIFLVKRGLWLIFVEIFIMSFAFTFDPAYPTIFFQTIWAIGISMVILGIMLWLPFRAILFIGLVIVLGHNTLDFYEATYKGQYSIIYSLMHRFGFYQPTTNHSLIILYPFLPWTGLMMLGYCFGRILTGYDGIKRNKILAWLGVSIILFFIALRATNLYGDAQHWSTQKNSLYTAFSFIDTVKYPPSLLFMCMTLGPGILFLSLFVNARSTIAKVIMVYGRVPFFYFILHFFLVHFISMVLFFARGHSFAEGWRVNPNIPFNFVLPGEGYSLGITYLVWLFVLIIMYPLCKWFSNYKLKHKKWWLSYL